MIQILPDGTKEVYCDRCGKHLTETVNVGIMGDAICSNCFDNEWKEKTIEEYLEENNF